MSNSFINSEKNDNFAVLRGIDLQNLLVETENYFLEYRDKLKTDPTTTTIQEPSEETQETALIDQILEEYNSNLPDENKISKSDLRYNMSRKYGRRKYYKTYLRRWSNNL